MPIMDSHPNKKTKLPSWKRWLFLSFLFGMTFAILEFSAHLYLKVLRGYDGKHLLQYEFDPYKNIIPTRNYVDTRGIRHNSQGFRRSAEISIAKPEDTYRIFLMGASTAYGLGGLWPHIQDDYKVIDNAQTIDAYLEKILRETFPSKKIEVINAAITSSWTHHHLIYLNQTIIKYDPDMIVFIDGFNDFYKFDKNHDQFASYAYQEHSHTIMGAPSLYSLAYTNMWWLYRKSALAYLTFRTLRDIKRNFTPRPTQQPLEIEAALPRLQKTFENNALKMWKRIAVLLQSEDIESIFVLQPMLILERDRNMPPVERELFDFNVEAWVPNYETFIHEAVALVSDRAGSAVSRHDGIFVDATNIFMGTKGQIFTDYAHLTPRGNEILARHISEYVVLAIQNAGS